MHLYLNYDTHTYTCVYDICHYSCAELFFQEVAHLRRELLIAARHILATDLRSRECTLSHTLCSLPPSHTTPPTHLTSSPPHPITSSPPHHLTTSPLLSLNYSPPHPLTPLTPSLAGFVLCIDQLFDEELLIGSGWTTKETVRWAGQMGGASAIYVY